MAACILNGPILIIPSYLFIELLTPGLRERFEAWMYELTRTAQAGKSYPSEVPMKLPNPFMTAGIAVMVLGVLYRVLLIAGFGVTLGKMVVHTRVTRADDPSAWTPEFMCALARTLTDELIGYFDTALFFLSTFVNYLIPLFIEKKQTLHDMMVGTIVVRN